MMVHLMWLFNIVGWLHMLRLHVLIVIYFIQILFSFYLFIFLGGLGF